MTKHLNSSYTHYYIIMGLFKTLNRDPTGVGQDLNISPDNILGPLFQEDVKEPRQVEKPIIKQRRAPVEDLFTGQRPSRFNNASNAGFNRLF